MKDHIVVAYLPGSYDEFQLVWQLEDEFGASIGEYGDDVADAVDDDDERLFRLAERVLRRFAAECGGEYLYRRQPREAWRFRSKAKAAEALRLIKAEWKALVANTPWPEWALKAVRNGWKPPKGWKP